MRPRQNAVAGYQNESEKDKNARLARRFILIFTAIGAACLFIYSLHTSLSWTWVSILGVGLLTASASFAVGGFLGFLFGIPRSATTHAADDKSSTDGTASNSQLPYRGNTNLEQISDWLTKIIVGVGLVELKGAPELFQRLAYFLGSGFTAAGAPRNDAISLDLMALFFVSGFFLSYLMARLFLQGAFITAESPIDKIAQAANEIAQSVASKPLIAVGTPIPSVELQVGETIKQLSKDSNIDSLRTQLLRTAAEYETRRGDMPSGAERTSEMEGIVSKFRVLAPSTYALLDEMAKGTTAGERLAAVVMLEVKPEPDYLEWLADRVASEKPFVGYHASLALSYANEKLEAKYKPAILKAVTRAEKELVERGLVNTDRREVLERARKAVSP